MARYCSVSCSSNDDMQAGEGVPWPREDQGGIQGTQGRSKFVVWLYSKSRSVVGTVVGFQPGG